MLGKKYRYFPSPYWSELHRDELPIEKMAQNSIISHISKLLKINQASVVNTQGMLKLVILKEYEVEIPSDALGTNAPLAILPLIDENADACLTFSPNNQKEGPEAISSPNSKGAVISGCFLLLLPDQKQYSTQIIEDGYVVKLTNEQWAEFWQAFKAKKEYKISSENDLALIVHWT
jgi:hypothetical protein